MSRLHIANHSLREARVHLDCDKFMQATGRQCPEEILIAGLDVWVSDELSQEVIERGFVPQLKASPGFRGIAHQTEPESITFCWLTG